MSIEFVNPGDGLTRSGSYLNPSSSFSVVGWLKINTSFGTGGDYKTAWLWGDNTYVASEMDVFINSSGQLIFEIFNGATTQVTTPVTSSLNTWYTWAIVYDSVGHTAKFYFNGALVDTLSINLSTITFSIKNEYLCTDNDGAISNISSAYVGIWQTTKSLAQLQQQWASTTFANNASLLAFTTLTSNVDLADTSGNSRNWTNVAGVGTTDTGPFPANSDPTTAIDLGTPPNTLTQRVDVNGIVPTVWYKYTAPAVGMIYLWIFGDVTVYKPILNVYLSPGTTTLYMDISSSAGTSALTSPVQFPVRAGETYLFKIFTNTHTTSSACNLTVEIKLFVPATSVPRESIAINDDAGRVSRDGSTTDTFPLGIFSSTASFTPLKYIPSFPTGETGDCLNTGISLVGNDDDSLPPLSLFLFDSQFNPLGTTDISGVASSLQDIRANRQISKFFILYYDKATPHRPHISQVSVAGAIESTTGVLAATTNGVVACCTDPTGTIAYYTDTTATAGIRRWDLINNIAMSDLVSIPSAVFARNMLCLSDGSIVVILLGSTNQIHRYDASGTLLTTYTAVSLGVDFLSGPDSRLAQSIDGMTFWYRNLANQAVNGSLPGYFIKVDAVLGTVLLRANEVIYTGGVDLSNYNSPSAPPGTFGHSESCTFWVLPLGLDTEGGIYKIVPNKRDDTLFGTGVVKIPDPGFTTGLIGG